MPQYYNRQIYSYDPYILVIFLIWSFSFYSLSHMKSNIILINLPKRNIILIYFYLLKKNTLKTFYEYVT